MGIVLASFVIALWLIALRSKDRWARLWWFGAGLLNALALAAMVANHSPYLFRLAPDNGYYERDWRR